MINNSIKIMIISAILLLTANMSLRVNAQEIKNMTIRQQNLSVVAALAAKGDMDGLRNALNEGFDKGLTLNEAKETLSQLYAYIGFPRSLNAIAALQEVVMERQSTGLRIEEGQDADPLPSDYNSLKHGTEVQTELFGPVNFAFVPQIDYYLKAHLFGDIFARNNLSWPDREVVTISAISALDGCDSQLQSHVASIRKIGVDDKTLKELPELLESQVDPDIAERLRKALATVFEEPYNPVKTVDFSIWPKGDVNPISQYFTGRSYLIQLDGCMNVTFEPGCRNFWHIHHGQVQVLICVSGRGWYQEWGKEPVELTPGVTISIPEGVKHWHGAARDSWMQHLTYHTDISDETSNEWLEPMSDDDYLQL